MKHLRMLTLSMLLVGAAVGTTKAQTLDEVVSKYITAMGGEAKLKALNSQIAEGSMSIQGMDFPLKVINLNKKAMRIEFEAMGTKNVQVITEKGGWMFLPVQQQTAPVDSDPADLADSQRDLDLTGELVDYKAKGHTAELIGKETIEGKELYKIKLTRKDASISNYFVDPATWYVAKRTSMKSIQGQEIEIVENFSDFKKSAGGYVYPAMTEQLPMGMKISYTKVETNPAIDEKTFEKPTAQ
ncbi:hypothetical protein GFS24_26640 [Chitinophaga sp. SYP-B3965]|uniref:hypothetical protein n=1 Tax=Chitinophaga sp. SYP-B3965 TaxID=2663120 RepID=UPI0012996098|nr:hypothetical protein [Chitinophaga sp. SYP-B3965]MRG48718.1 hypothetical protein [Chitinophaga sp. SYP-B3965]